MASEAENAQLQGFKELLRVSGESLRIYPRNRAVTGIVDRGLDEPELDKGQVNFDERNQSSIEILRTDVDPAPDPGQWFRDSDGFFHRIRTVQRTKITYRCKCEVAEPE